VLIVCFPGTGCGEGWISSLKRGYGWDRTRIDGTASAQIWTGQGVFAHNLVKIGARPTSQTQGTDQPVED